jgi:hypothetical protein
MGESKTKSGSWRRSEGRMSHPLAISVSRGGLECGTDGMGTRVVLRHHSQAVVR